MRSVCFENLISTCSLLSLLYCAHMLAVTLNSQLFGCCVQYPSGSAPVKYVLLNKTEIQAG